MLYFLLGIIAIGVLLLSRPGQALLGWIIGVLLLCVGIAVAIAVIYNIKYIISGLIAFVIGVILLSAPYLLWKKFEAASPKMSQYAETAIKIMIPALLLGGLAYAIISGKLK